MPDAPQRAQEAVSYAKERNFEREAVIDQRDIMRDALRRGMGDLTFSQVRDNFEHRHAIGEFQTVEPQKHDTGPRLTTPETIAAERATVEHMQRGQNTVAPIMSEQRAASHAAAIEFLNPAQRRAIEEILTSRDQIHGLQGLAGAGKTTTLAAVREAAQHNGYTVAGFAPTARAAHQLREAAGISADTLQAYLAMGTREQAQTNRDDPANRRLFLIDESSLTSTQQMKEFLDRLGPHDRVLLIGDTRQHQAVDAGKPFEQLQDAGMRTAQLDQIVRQKDPELLKAVEHLARNETHTGISLLQAQGRITEISNPARAHRRHRQGLRLEPRKDFDRLSRQRFPARHQSGREDRVTSLWRTRKRECFFPCARGSKRHERRRSSMGRQVQPRRHRAVHSWQPTAWPGKKHLRHGRSRPIPQTI